MDLVVGWGSVNWIGLAMDRDRWRAVVSAVVNPGLRSALFWVITQRVVVIPYRRFVFFFGFLTPEDGTDRLSRNVSKKLPLLAV